MTIALPVSSGRKSRAPLGLTAGFRTPAYIDLRETFSATWESLASDRTTATAPLSLNDIEVLLSGRTIDVTDSENATTYVEWETADGFASLEIGSVRFGFSFIADEGSAAISYGESGTLDHRDAIAALIRKHS